MLAMRQALARGSLSGAAMQTLQNRAAMSSLLGPNGQPIGGGGP
jgi:hypothetical protein